jgi:chemotaxis protein CheC
MAPDPEEVVSDDEIQILQELMNIAFGKAAADLAEVMDMYVLLSVPGVGIMPARELPRFICSETLDHPRVSVVGQNFWGDFRGSAFLVLPSSGSKELLSLLGEQPGTADGAPYEPIDELERETLMEVGNIIIGACVGKLSELLGTVVRYTPPSATIDNPPASAIPPDLFDPGDSAVVLRTTLGFRDRDVKGFMSLVSSGGSIRWLKAALGRFMAQYA